MQTSGAGAAVRSGPGTPEVAPRSSRLTAVPGTGPSGGHPGPERAARLVVFLGVDDDGRSRLAAALLAHRSRGRVRAVSASPVALEPDPLVTRSLAEVGVDLARCPSQPPTPRLLELADLVVVMGYDERTAAAAGRTEDWYIDDPRGKSVDAVRCIRDAIDRRVQRLLIRLGAAVPARRPPEPGRA
jgi:arsenate reductase (thioredoxin)